MAENIFEIPAVKTGIVYPETPGEKASLNPEQRLEETVRLAAAINLEAVSYTHLTLPTNSSV